MKELYQKRLFNSRLKRLAGLHKGDKDFFREGWDACKEEVLKILKQDCTGLDMSPNSCDSYYIDKIKEL